MNLSEECDLPFLVLEPRSLSIWDPQVFRDNIKNLQTKKQVSSVSDPRAPSVMSPCCFRESGGAVRSGAGRQMKVSLGVPSALTASHRAAGVSPTGRPCTAPINSDPPGAQPCSRGPNLPAVFGAQSCTV